MAFWKSPHASRREYHRVGSHEEDGDASFTPPPKSGFPLRRTGSQLRILVDFLIFGLGLAIGFSLSKRGANLGHDAQNAMVPCEYFFLTAQTPIHNFLSQYCL